MGDSRKIDKRGSLRVVTDNNWITAPELADLTLNARKLVYIAIAQCKKTDSEFYEYETTPAELAEIWGIDSSNVYRAADKITDELMKLFFKLPAENEEGYDKEHLFEKCSYRSHVVRFKLHKEMTNHLLKLDGSFTKPLVKDFMKMSSPYTMAIWHLMQREMKSFKPMMSAPIEFDITMEELRQVTGTRNKLKQVGQFKDRVLDKALEEIETKCFVKITYVNLKEGRTVTGFRFTAENVMGNIQLDKLSFREQKQARKAMLVKKRADGLISKEEEKELQDLIQELSQVTIEDVLKGY